MSDIETKELIDENTLNAEGPSSDAAPSIAADTSRNTLKLIIVGLIVVVLVAAMWVLKNNPFAQSDTHQKTGSEQAATESDEALSLESGEMDPNELVEYGLPILLDFGSDTCPPCVAMHPDLESLHENMNGKAIVKYADTGKYSNIIMRYPIRVTPTQILIMPDGTPYKPSEAVRNSGISFVEYANQETNEHALTLHEGYLDESQMTSIIDDMISQSK